MLKSCKLILACALLVTAMVNPAIASVATFSVSVGTQPSNVGTITVTDGLLGGTAVTVGLDLMGGYGILNTGGPHTPFAFNLNVDPTTVTLTLPGDFSTPAGGTYAFGQFSYNSAGGSNTPFGFFNGAIDSTAANGSTSAYYGDLLFTLHRGSGLSIANFVANGDGYIFSADLTDGTNTGAQAWKVSQVPIPAALPLFLTALAGLGFIVGRKRATA